MEMQITNPFSQINNRLRKDSKAESRIEIKLNMSFKIFSTVINHSVKQNSKATGTNFWYKWARLLKWLIQIIVSLGV